jgi:PAS domain S-box-containing protein
VPGRSILAENSGNTLLLQRGIMSLSPPARPQRTHRRGLYVGSILISLAVFTLLGAAFLPKLYARPFSSVLLTLVLLALALAIGLHIRFLILFRREHGATAKALTTTEHEFQAIFDSALDGFLIVDEQGACMEANPAALAILGARRDEIIGHAIGEFFPQGGAKVIEFGSGHGEIRIVRRDGRSVFLEYAKTGYLPGRHSLVLRDVSKRNQAEAELRESREQFLEMAENIAEVFWTIDVDTKRVIYVSPAFETLTGRSLETLRVDPTSYQELFHPEDRVRVLAQLEEAVRTGRFDEEFRIVREDRAVRWVWVRASAVRDSSGRTWRLVGTAQDITARKSAEREIARSLELARSAWAEADALRKTTLALTQNLSMDTVLDTLLDSLLTLIPCDSARVLLSETEERLFLVRERRVREQALEPHRSPMTWNAADHGVLLKVLATQNLVLVRNTAEQEGWKHFKGHSHFRSWLGVPLVASEGVLGLLSLGDSQAYLFTQEHLRLAQSLAIPAAVAIQNARLYERAAIYGVELERRVADLEQTQRALEEAEKHQDVFRGKHH